MTPSRLRVNTRCSCLYSRYTKVCPGCAVYNFDKLVGFPDHPQEISICRTKGRNHRGNKSPTSTFSPNLGSFSSGAAFFPLRPFIWQVSTLPSRIFPSHPAYTICVANIHGLRTKCRLPLYLRKWYVWPAAIYSGLKRKCLDYRVAYYTINRSTTSSIGTSRAFVLLRQATVFAN